jgi:signal transduction histidine kinase
MGLRHRSIRLRVGILIIVPVLCLLALYGFVASITFGSALTQTHAKSIKDDLATPVTTFLAAIDSERHDALLSLADPTSTQYASKLGQQENTTQGALTDLKQALAAPSVTSYASAGEHTAITALLNQTKHNLPALRQDVADDAVSLHSALAQYDAIIDAGYLVINDAIAEQTNVQLVTQAQAVIALTEADQSVAAETDLLTADITQLKFPESDRMAFAELASGRQVLTARTLPQLEGPYRTLLSKDVPPALAAALGSAESAVINTPWHKGPPPAQLLAASPAFANYAKGMSTALAAAAVRLEDQADHNANVVVLQLVLAAGLGLVGAIFAIVLSLVIGRSLVRQLRELRESALSLAHEKLPGVIRQLRAGEAVDVDEYAPEQTTSGNEIDQVQQAFGIVRQTAIKSAVDEARLRRGISEVFRNLAGRSQSLLHRQLTLLDGMERRATEPDELEDLFRIDHLTTRMRRHAEGLIILSGEAPARGWRQPVPLVDVLRAAVAEVEDYTRIRVVARTNAAVAGHAVADVIHLIAELAENATVFSPPNTPVRIQGDIVGRGFAIEIEDRGLGISQARLEEINTNLDNPPQFDLSGSDRLGLFIAGQLAKRHDIKITLRPSVYGGTSAIVLVPTALVVDEGAYSRDPALPAGSAPADSSAADRFSARTAALAQAAGRHGNGSVASLADYSRMSLAIGSRPEADEPPVVAAAVIRPEPDAQVSTEELAELGLPVRVRQASMAPQLRDARPAETAAGSAAGQSAPPGRPAVPLHPVAEAASPEQARSTMSALQRGWQLGRAEGEQAAPDGSTFSGAGDALTASAGDSRAGRTSEALPRRGDDLLPGRTGDSFPARADASFPARADDAPGRRADDAIAPGADDVLLRRTDDPVLPRRGSDTVLSRADDLLPRRDDRPAADPLPQRSDPLPLRSDALPQRSGGLAGRMDDALSGRLDEPLPGQGHSNSGNRGGSPFGWPDNPFVTRTDSGQFARPDSGSHARPDSGSYARPDSGSHARPDTDSFDRADTGSFDRPDTGSYGWNEPGPFGRPDNEPFGRPAEARSDSEPLSPSAGASLGWPDSTIPGRLITDRLPADPLAADRLAAERRAAERLAADGNAGSGASERDDD